MAPDSHRPIIGLTVELLQAPEYTGRRRFQLFPEYLECLREAGAHPVLLPSDPTSEQQATEIPAILDLLDGLLLTGGDDPDLRLLGGPEPLELCKPIPEAQQRSCLAYLQEAQRRKMPVLGICLGMQLMGLAEGAPFHQHLSQGGHEKGARHGVQPIPGSLLADVLGSATRFEILSYHHQALADTGPGLLACGHADDGLLEAVEWPDHPFGLGVQWHPERTPQSRSSRRLFSSFCRAAKIYHHRRVQGETARGSAW
ncbi:MAG: gamma-glutamyl-gamma-aminobutyrate hydrolase family protein [Planctomycetota bacterium]|nr:MAG: gamma-glutamyl-gamma-aminobutyrate hydrolase family protein [Planctomycetota bacterium]